MEIYYLLEQVRTAHIHLPNSGKKKRNGKEIESKNASIILVTK